MVTEGKRLENARCKVVFGEIAALAPTRLSVFRFFYIINLRILFSVFSSERIDERLLIGSKLEPSVWNIGSQHFALHRQRIDGDELQCAILLFFSGNTAVARLLGEIQFIACRHPFYALLKCSHHSVSLRIAQFANAMVITFSIYPGFPNYDKLSVW